MAAKTEHPENAVAQPTPAQIADRARALWRERGSPGGRDLEHWLEAERQLRNEMDAREGIEKKTTGEAAALDAAERRLDGLVKRRPSPASRTPSGEQL